MDYLTSLNISWVHFVAFLVIILVQDLAMKKFRKQFEKKEFYLMAVSYVLMLAAIILL